MHMYIIEAWGALFIPRGAYGKGWEAGAHWEEE